MFKSKYIVETLNLISRHNPALAATLDERMGFIVASDIPGLMAYDPKLNVLVRCGNGRFQCPVNELAGVVAVITQGQHKKYDYVRDVSIPVPVTVN